MFKLLKSTPVLVLLVLSMLALVVHYTTHQLPAVLTQVAFWLAAAYFAAIIVVAIRNWYVEDFQANRRKRQEQERLEKEGR